MSRVISTSKQKNHPIDDLENEWNPLDYDNFISQANQSDLNSNSKLYYQLSFSGISLSFPSSTL